MHDVRGSERMIRRERRVSLGVRRVIFENHPRREAQEVAVPMLSEKPTDDSSVEVGVVPSIDRNAESIWSFPTTQHTDEARVRCVVVQRDAATLDLDVDEHVAKELREAPALCLGIGAHEKTKI